MVKLKACSEIARPPNWEKRMPETCFLFHGFEAAKHRNFLVEMVTLSHKLWYTMMGYFYGHLTIEIPWSHHRLIFVVSDE